MHARIPTAKWHNVEPLGVLWPTRTGRRVQPGGSAEVCSWPRRRARGHRADRGHHTRASFAAMRAPRMRRLSCLQPLGSKRELAASSSTSAAPTGTTVRLARTLVRGELSRRSSTRTGAAVVATCLLARVSSRAERAKTAWCAESTCVLARQGRCQIKKSIVARFVLLCLFTFC